MTPLAWFLIAAGFIFLMILAKGSRRMSCNPFRSLLRSCRRFFFPNRFSRFGYLVTQLEKIMADLAPIKDAVTALDAKVTAHLAADASATQALVDANTALQAQVVDLTAALAAAGASPEEIAAIVASIEAVGTKFV